MVEVSSVILIRMHGLSLMEMFAPLFEVAYEYLLNPSFAGVNMMKLRTDSDDPRLIEEYKRHELE